MMKDLLNADAGDCALEYHSPLSRLASRVTPLPMPVAKCVEIGLESEEERQENRKQR
jgi:hypothetical protein